MEEILKKHALINAVEHDGKADVQAVIGKLIAERPEIRTRIKDVFPLANKIVDEVNSLSVEEQENIVEKLGLAVEKKKIEEKGLPELKNAEVGGVVMRLAPFPSGPLHIGNTRMVVLNDEYAKKYKGKLLLVFDDTIGSKEKTILPEAYQMIEDDLEWLGVKYDGKFYKSDRMQIFYEYATKMIDAAYAYVCTCSEEEVRRNRKKGIECPCRERNVVENLELWRDMLAGKVKEGRATVRLKGDMRHPNPAFRDRVLLRISEREHPRVGKKYRVWPMLEFSWAVDDYLLGVTHILRGKQLVIEDMMEKLIWQMMGWPKKEFVHYGMLKVEGVTLSKSITRKMIESGVLSGWDDPRTWTLQSLKKRGFQPQAIRKFILKMGLSEADVAVPLEILYAENRKLIDPIANRYMAVFSPVTIPVKNAPPIDKVEVQLHPDFPERGKKQVMVDTNKICIEKEDREKFKGKEVGLINLFSVRLDEDVEYVSKEIRYDIPKIHWVSEPNVKIKIVMPNGEIKQALAEPTMRSLKEGDIVQLYRIGFCRVDKAEKDIVLYFAHK
jgi:glutamyl-tRNA synthetase